MWEFEICLHSVEEVRQFVSFATVQSFSITVGKGSRWVNGKSFIGMFSLDYSQPLKVRVQCEREAFEVFRDAAARFWAK